MMSAIFLMRRQQQDFLPLLTAFCNCNLPDDALAEKNELHQQEREIHRERYEWIMQHQLLREYSIKKSPTPPDMTNELTNDT